MSSAALVSSALAGTPATWERLVRRHEPLLRTIGRQYRLAPHDLDDAMQSTWLDAFRKLGTLREPAALPAWLATTMRRQCLRTLQRHLGEVLVCELAEHGSAPDPLTQVLAAERRAALAGALDRLPARHRALIAQLGVENYAQASARLGMPIGSIGPIRARALARLERDAALRDLCA